jgi:phosphoglycerate dehydrogenase-like enzyme
MQVREADILYSWQIPEGVPGKTPTLRWIHLPSAGIDHLRRLSVWKSDVLLSASMGIHTIPMSEHLFAMLLTLTRRITSMVKAQDGKEWIHTAQDATFRMTELRGKTLAIIGWGKIGDGVAHLAQAFGMRIIGTRWSLTSPREVPLEASRPHSDPPWLPELELAPNIVYPAARLHEVLAEGDVVVVLAPLTDETHHLIGEAELRCMKRGSLLLNLARGSVVDESALIRALRSGRLGGAGLDVFAHEPLPRSSPLWSMENVIVSPHVGGMSEETRHRAANFFAENLDRYLNGRPLLNLVDRKQGY